MTQLSQSDGGDIHIKHDDDLFIFLGDGVTCQKCIGLVEAANDAIMQLEDHMGEIAKEGS